MQDPLAKRLLLPQRPPNAEAKVSGVGIHKSRCNATIATMPVNERQLTLTHFPCFLQDLTKNSVENDFSWMVAVKVDFHCVPLVCWSRGTERMALSRARFNSNLVVYGFSQTLLAAKILFGGLHGHVAQQELNLFEFASRRVTQTGTGSSEVMRRELQDSNLPRVLLDDMPHHFFCHFVAPGLACSTDAAK
jgi:hypothetical protein